MQLQTSRIFVPSSRIRVCRVVTKTGLQNLIRSSQLPPPSSDSALEPGPFEPASYRAVHSLAANSDKRNFEDLLKKTAEAIFMCKCLKFNGFFGGLSSGSSSDNLRGEVFVSSLLLKHLQVVGTNGLEIAECILKNNDITKFDIIPVGGAIFPTMSFFNHSCYPNAMRIGYQAELQMKVREDFTITEKAPNMAALRIYANQTDCPL